MALGQTISEWWNQYPHMQFDNTLCAFNRYDNVLDPLWYRAEGEKQNKTS